MAPGKKASARRPSTPSPSQLSPTETLAPSQSQELPPQNSDALGDVASLTQSNNAGRQRSTRVRGKTTGKGVDKLIARHGGVKLPVPVLEEWNSLCGVNAPKASFLLGVYIRMMAPIKNTLTWWAIDEATQSAIIQAVLDKVNISDDYHNNPLAQKVVHTKCYHIHINWRYKMKCHYRQVKKQVKKGDVVDVYSSPYDNMTPENWRHLIDDVWLGEKHKRKSRAGKKNRKKLGPGGHCSGSRSFVAAMTTPPEDNGYANLDFPEFYQKTHTKKDNNWIHDDCPENHTKMLNLRSESSQSGLQLTREEISREVLGKRKRYILGFGVGPKSTSSSPQIDVLSQARDEEFQKMKNDMERMQMEREEEKREREEEKNEREEARRVREEERREREQEKREREEERRQHEAEQNKLAALLLQWQEKTQPQSSHIHHGWHISPTSIGGRKACW